MHLAALRHSPQPGHHNVPESLLLILCLSSSPVERIFANFAECIEPFPDLCVKCPKTSGTSQIARMSQGRLLRLLTSPLLPCSCYRRLLCRATIPFCQNSFSSSEILRREKYFRAFQLISLTVSKVSKADNVKVKTLKSPWSAMPQKNYNHCLGTWGGERWEGTCRVFWTSGCDMVSVAHRCSKFLCWINKTKPYKLLSFSAC